ncbi:hypothetical protein Pla22_13750 [Rubripirellula amarantea]|uniref:Tricarballylate dehydrogenase n=2 Tax=Rubripirellula amarantea TaxID=2527999 RepID=A0A5C5WUR5_9BACT|nr:hypothetical protein Pla22_13750 [Rubripirellula amarantea]
MVAATQAALRGARVILLEKNSKTGVKILMSGGTRCNITHNTDARGITEAFGKAKRFLQPSVGRFSPTDVVKMFNDAGVGTKVESTGKIFPVSNRAVQVRDALHQLAIDSGVELRLRTSVKDVKRHQADGKNQWSVVTENQTADSITTESLTADAVIITAGGRSWPGCGTTGDAYAWLTQLGHTIVRTRPALVPLVGGTAWMRSLSGITLEDCVATVRQKNEQGEVKTGRKAVLTSRRASMLLTHFGLSGPAAMDVSGVMTEARSMNNVHLEIDVVPEIDEASLNHCFAASNPDSAKRNVSTIISRMLPQRMADCIVQSIGTDCTVAQLPATMRRDLITQLKRMPVSITGTKGFEKAEVTAGGVALSEVDPKTMQSRLHPGLFIAGEVLDVDGWIGGYNFQSAFSTGHLAGSIAAEN